MSFSVVDEIYKSYISDGMNRDTEKANMYFDKILDDLQEILSIDLQNKIHNLIGNYSLEVEERSFKDGLKYGVNLYKELQ